MQRSGSYGVTQLLDRVVLQLADPLGGHAVLISQLLQGGLAVRQPAAFENVAAAIIQRQQGGAQLAGVTVLIVLLGKQGVLYRDPSVTFTPGLEAALARLEERGIDLIGFADSDEDEHAVELVSEFKVEKGLAPFGSVSAEQEIARWLTGKEDLSLAVWIAPDPDNPSGEPKAWLVPSGKLSHEEVSAAAKILGDPGV